LGLLFFGLLGAGAEAAEPALVLLLLLLLLGPSSGIMGLNSCTADTTHLMTDRGNISKVHSAAS
jgi:hypothetical protein